MTLRAAWQADISAMLSAKVFVAKVDSTSGGLVKIIRADQAAADGQFYPAATGLAAAVSGGEFVFCVEIGGTVFVLLELEIS